MTEDRMLDLVGRPGGPLADASLLHLEVIDAGPLTPNVHRLVLSGPSLRNLRYKAGQDLMFRIPLPKGRVVNRRYTIRKLDRDIPSVTLNVSLHGAGPGTSWIRSAEAGSRIDAIGPRGKIAVHDDVDWHLFVDDDTGLPGALAMIESLGPGSVAIGLFEIDSPADELRPANNELRQLDVRFSHRLGRSRPGDPALLLAALSGVDLPVGRGQVYVAAETHVVRAVQSALGERGIPPEQVAAKAYWRHDLANAENGEPSREE